MYNEIFVKPQKETLEQYQKKADSAIIPFLESLKETRKQKDIALQKQKVTYITKTHPEPVTFQKVSNVRSVIKLPDGGVSFVDEIEDNKNITDHDETRDEVMSNMKEG